MQIFWVKFQTPLVETNFILHFTKFLIISKRFPTALVCETWYGLPVVASPTDRATRTAKEKKNNSHDNQEYANALKNGDFGEHAYD